jgi:hypothetical protein
MVSYTFQVGVDIFTTKEEDVLPYVSLFANIRLYSFAIRYHRGRIPLARNVKLEHAMCDRILAARAVGNSSTGD